MQRHPPETALPIVPESKFGTDHWSTLLHIAHVCCDGGGQVQLDPAVMRCNAARHPAFAKPDQIPWKPDFGTKLQGHLLALRRRDPDRPRRLGLHLVEHDAWDCVSDLAQAGFLDILCWPDRHVRLTAKGLSAMKQMMAAGVGIQHLSWFEYKPEAQP